MAKSNSSSGSRSRKNQRGGIALESLVIIPIVFGGITALGAGVEAEARRKKRLNRQTQRQTQRAKQTMHRSKSPNRSSRRSSKRQSK